MSKLIDLTGQRFDKLVVIERVKSTKRTRWLCKCDCGNMIDVDASNLKRTDIRHSCGCAKKEALSGRYLQDITGQSFGRLSAIKCVEHGSQNTKWLCKCSCGKEVVVLYGSLVHGTTKSCGCIREDGYNERNADLIGNKFDHLSIIRKLDVSERNDKKASLLCLCDCGNYVHVSPYEIRKGKKKSCGCSRFDSLPLLWENNKKYKHFNSRLYGVYKSMRDRCYNKKHREYNNYGCRGIIVCKEWSGDKGYDNFYEWSFMNGYDPDAKRGVCTLERIDTNGIYEPTNCRWATNIEQQNNKRTNIRETYNGEEHTLAEWSRLLNVNRHTLYSNHRAGYSLEYYISKHKIQYP